MSGATRSPHGAGLATANVFAASNTFQANLLHTGTKVGLFGGAPTVRIPFVANPAINGPAAVASGTENLVGVALNPNLNGNFTGIGGADPGQAWGLNVFATASADLAGLSNITGGLIELAVLTSTGTIPVARGFHADLAFFSSSAGATIDQAETARFSAPSRKNGAVAGNINNAYVAFFEDVGSLASGSKFTVFTVGGVSRFGGRTDVTDQIANNGSGDLSVFAGFSNADGARLSLKKAGNGGHAQFVLATTGANLFINNGTTDVITLRRDGSGTFTGALSGTTASFSGNVTLGADKGVEGSHSLTLYGGAAGDGSQQSSIVLGNLSAGGGVAHRLGWNGAQHAFQNSSGAKVAAISNAGAIFTQAHAAPADAELAAGEASIWFDQTNGAAKLMVKAKQADGTVRTGQLALA